VSDLWDDTPPEPLPDDTTLDRLEEEWASWLTARERTERHNDWILLRRGDDGRDAT
jgi:hypothetical protein